MACRFKFNKKMGTNPLVVAIEMGQTLYGGLSTTITNRVTLF